MNHRRAVDILEIAVHTIIVLLGIIILFVAHSITDLFWQSLLVNIGSSLVVVTVLFFIFEIFRRRHAEQNADSNTSNILSNSSNDLNIAGSNSQREKKADEIINALQQKQQSSVINKTSKVNHK